mmetsp:Transcript_47514/g.143787  ORF Transcript_47514/g.143787 Transcript_47514/m.143787 type:complete len:255 (+) Transcript_47514:246-1010(+)
MGCFFLRAFASDSIARVRCNISLSHLMCTFPDGYVIGSSDSVELPFEERSIESSLSPDGHHSLTRSASDKKVRSVNDARIRRMDSWAAIARSLVVAELHRSQGRYAARRDVRCTHLPGYGRSPLRTVGQYLASQLGLIQFHCACPLLASTLRALGYKIFHVRSNLAFLSALVPAYQNGHVHKYHYYDHAHLHRNFFHRCCHFTGVCCHGEGTGAFACLWRFGNYADILPERGAEVFVLPLNSIPVDTLGQGLYL